MKNQIIKKSLAALFIVTASQVAAQSKPADPVPAKKEIPLPAISVLIDSALKHSGMVAYRKYDVQVKEANLVTQRNQWLRNFGVQGDTRYGTIDAFSTSGNGTTSVYSSNTSRQFNYAIGVYIKMPVFEFANRKNIIKQAKAEIEEAKGIEKAQQEEIRQLVIKQYQDLLLRQKLLNIKSQNMGTASVNMEMVEKEFRNGVIPVAEYVRLSDMTARIQSEYEIALSDYVVSKKLLEETIGFTFSNPELKVKK